MKTALITGISGQDGSYLSELLLSKGYEVHGIVRRHSVAESQASRIEHLDVTTHYGDLLDPGSIERVFIKVLPDEFYNLAAMSHVRVSFDVPEFTMKTNGLPCSTCLKWFAITDRSVNSIRPVQARCLATA